MLSTFSRTLKALALLAVGLSTAAQAQETVSVFSYNGARQATTVSVPKNPERVVVIDYAVLPKSSKFSEWLKFSRSQDYTILTITKV